MPLLFLHGVSNRPGASWQATARMVEVFLRRYVAPAISDDPDGVPFLPVMWGDLGAKLAWNGASRPRSALLGMGAEPDAVAMDRMLTVLAHPGLAALPVAPVAGPTGLIAAGAAPPAAPAAPDGGDGADGPGLLGDLPPERLADLLVACLLDPAAVEPGTGAPGGSGTPTELAAVLAAADEVARDPATEAALAGVRDAAGQVAIVRDLFERHCAELLAEQEALVGMGAGPWAARLRDRLGEATSRGRGVPAWAASRVLLEARGPVNDAVTMFIGDVLRYLVGRGPVDAPGPIPRRLLDALERAARLGRDRGGEPVVLLTHSMGGQLGYDALTGYLPADPRYADVRVDFWCAAASQVGLFEELKLFLASSSDYGAAAGRKVPVPDAGRLGRWWNVWDPNDVLSFTAAPVFDGVLDEPFDGGLSLVGAHGGYLARPSFYRRLRRRLEGVAPPADGPG
jgi:hypothetical protein